jgi:hypothetical protein
MKQLRLMGLALMAVFALGVVVVASASAAEAGLLYLTGEKGAVTFEGTGGEGTLTSTAGTITCTATSTTATSTQTEKHVTSGTATIGFTGCKETKETTKVACNTEGDAKEAILLPANFTLFNALNSGKTELEPGIGVTLTSTLKIKCGAVSIVEVKGTALGLITGASLTADITEAKLHFINAGETCDSEDTFCKEHTQGTAGELLANFSGKFEKATEQTDVGIKTNKMVLIDD